MSRVGSQCWRGIWWDGGGEYGGWLTLDIGAVSTEVSKGAQCVKNGVEGVAEFVGQGGFAVRGQSS